MRVKLTIPLLAGAVAFSIAGFAVAGPGKAFFSSSANALSTIGDLVSTSLWNTQSSDNVPVPTNSKRISITPPSSQVLHNISPSQTDRKYNYVPSVNLQPADYSPINSGTSVVDYGYTSQDGFSGGNSGNTFVGGLGGGANWGSVPDAKVPSNGGGLYYYFPGGGIGLGGGGIGLGGGGIGLSPTAIPSTWTLSTNGTLTYSVNGLSVAAVPEPGEWLLMLAGFGLVGFIAKLRKQIAVFV